MACPRMEDPARMAHFMCPSCARGPGGAAPPCHPFAFPPWHRHNERFGANALLCVFVLLFVYLLPERDLIPIELLSILWEEKRDSAGLPGAGPPICPPDGGAKAGELGLRMNRRRSRRWTGCQMHRLPQRRPPRARPHPSFMENPRNKVEPRITRNTRITIRLGIGRVKMLGV
jgi:hypothetical protein